MDEMTWDEEEITIAKQLMAERDRLTAENERLKAKMERIADHLDWVEKGIVPCVCDQLEPDYRPCAGCEATHSAKGIRKLLDEAQEAMK